MAYMVVTIASVPESVVHEIGNIVVVICFLFVLMMQAGLALFECGISRSRNIYTILARTYTIFFEVCIVYWALGHAFAYSTGMDFLGYHSYWVGLDVDKGNYSTWLFGLAVCTTTTNIIATSLVERATFKSFFIFTFFSVAFCQPVVIHWCWHPEGWLLNHLKGVVYKDFAGSGVIHVYAGIIGILGCAILQPRTSRFKGDQFSRSPKTFHGHSKPFLFLGGILILIGFLSLRLMAVFQYQGSKTVDKGLSIIINTLISCSFSSLTACLVAALVDYCGIACCAMKGRHDWWQLLTGINSAIAGVASSAGGCNDYYSWTACVNGLVSGFVYITWSLLIRSCQADDPLDVAAVHLGCGLWGLICAPVFGTSGFIYNPGSYTLETIAWNVAGGCSIVVWAGVPFALLFGFMQALGVFRVSFDRETKDLNSLGSFKRRESVRTSGRRRPSIQWNVPFEKSEPTSFRRSYRQPSWQQSTRSFRKSFPSDWQTNPFYEKNTLVSGPPPYHELRPYWWRDSDTGRRYHGQQPVVWGSCPDLRHA
ncbi:ammonium transporter 2 isoform X2 [Patella vulgata]|uniref:ammonium transporter 2 isoform X2 n=1 Tax=Patella vulgata TaxID=6465 RepID=UPI00217FD11B|nr:ammonium transporter 2 isoform X2 [Patella vulgata]